MTGAGRITCAQQGRFCQKTRACVLERRFVARNSRACGLSNPRAPVAIVFSRSRMRAFARAFTHISQRSHNQLISKTFWQFCKMQIACAERKTFSYCVASVRQNESAAIDEDMLVKSKQQFLLAKYTLLRDLAHTGSLDSEKRMSKTDNNSPGNPMAGLFGIKPKDSIAANTPTSSSPSPLMPTPSPSSPPAAKKKSSKAAKKRSKRRANQSGMRRTMAKRAKKRKAAAAPKKRRKKRKAKK